ncbi:MAG: hypothetical protein HWE39_02180 [Oceanospirillaceae bacterium]|nr:hypothetical protein [Oceanospirillaceae bacterium]
MRLQFFQRLLDLLDGRVVVINDRGEILLASQAARWQLGLAPGRRLDLLHREGERVVVRQPLTQQLHSAIALRWLKLEFLLLKTPSVQPLAESPTELSQRHRELVEFCRRPELLAVLPAAERRALRALTGTDDGQQFQSIHGQGFDALEMVRLALAPPFAGRPEFFFQVPTPLLPVGGDRQQLASALRCLSMELVARHRCRRLLVRLHQGRNELLITVQDIGEMELPGMQRLTTALKWRGALLDQMQACEVVERFGGRLKLRGPVAQGRISIGLPTAPPLSLEALSSPT